MISLTSQKESFKRREFNRGGDAAWYSSCTFFKTSFAHSQYGIKNHVIITTIYQAHNVFNNYMYKPSCRLL